MPLTEGRLTSLAGLAAVLALGHGARAAPADRRPPRPPSVQSGSAARSERCLTGSAHQPAIQEVIRRVFGPRHARTAIRVAKCESGERGTAARNGQFRGLFQMGHKARRLYGGGRCAEEQVRAAHLYFVAEKRRWTAWRGCLRRRR